jgi:copper transport protein
MVAGIGHAIAMSVWLGGLLLLTRVVLAGPGEEDLVHAVRGFRRLSGPAIAITIVTGAVQTFRLDRGGALFSTNHGRVLLLKALVVGAMVFVGFATRQFIAQRVARVDAMTAPLAARLRRATGAEALAGVVVLGLSAWMMGLAPGGLTVTDTAHKSYGYRQGHVVEGDLDLTVSLTGVVGPNGVRVDVLKPTTGLSNVVITFLPPPDSGGSQVVLTLPGALKGTGAAVLDAAAGVPLNSPGVWTMQITATTSSGPKTAQKTFTLPVLG